MRLHLKKLNSSGVAHHFLIAVLAISFVASFGAYKVFFSKAATNYSGVSAAYILDFKNAPKADKQRICFLLGREWNGSKDTCKDACRSGAGTFVKIDPKKVPASYCTNAVATKVSPASCVNTYHRFYLLEVGCAARVANDDANGAKQCLPEYPNYNGKADSPDTCVARELAKAPDVKAAPTKVNTQALPVDTKDAKAGTKPTTPTTTPPTTTTKTPASTTTKKDEAKKDNSKNNSQSGTNKSNSTTKDTKADAKNNANNKPKGKTQQNCPDGSKPDTKGKCKKEETKPQPAVTTIVAVDASMTKKDCLLLGREWQPGNKSGQAKGCSTESCDKAVDKLVPNNGNPVCKKTKTDTLYATRLSEEQCGNLHRRWISQVSLCAQVPNSDSKNKEIVKADQCVAPHTTYVTKAGKMDECFKPDLVNRAQGVAKTVGQSLNSVLKTGPAAVCKMKKGYHWSDGQCRKDRNKDSDAPTGKLPPKTTKVDKAFCEQKLHRTYDGNGGCTLTCVAGYGSITSLSGNQWDYCKLSDSDAIHAQAAKNKVPTSSAPKQTNKSTKEIVFVIRGGKDKHTELANSCVVTHGGSLDTKDVSSIWSFKRTYEYTCTRSRD